MFCKYDLLRARSNCWHHVENELTFVLVLEVQCTLQESMKHCKTGIVYISTFPHLCCRHHTSDVNVQIREGALSASNHQRVVRPRLRMATPRLDCFAFAFEVDLEDISSFRRAFSALDSAFASLSSRLNSSICRCISGESFAWSPTRKRTC